MIKVNLVYNRKAINGYSLYLKYYCTEKQKSIKSETLNIYVSKKYDKATPLNKVAQIDRQSISIAREILQKRQIEILESRFSMTFVEKQSNKKKNLLDDIKKVVEDKKHRTYNAMLKYLEEHLAQGGSVELKGFQNYLIENTKLAQTSISHYVRRLKIILTVLEVEMPKTKILPTKHKPRVFLDAEQIQKIASLELDCEAAIITKYAYLFACFTGLRISDFLKLKFSDIENNVMKVTIKKTKTYKEFPLSETAVAIIEKMKDLHQADNPFPVGLYSFENHIEKIGAMIGVKLTAHTARHTFATSMMEQGVDLLVIKELLGHKNIASTMIYTHVKNKTLMEAVGKMPKINFNKE